MNYDQTVEKCLSQLKLDGSTSEQETLRTYIALAPSFLAFDSNTTSPEDGIGSWSTGFGKLANALILMHSISRLEYETINAAFRVAEECYNTSDATNNPELVQEKIGALVQRLKEVTDDPAASTLTFNGKKIDFDIFS